jgi:hypothetical protein
MMEKRIDSLLLLAPLCEANPDISLGELRQFVANAPSSESATLRYSVAAVAALALIAGAFIFGFDRSMDSIVHAPIMASVSPLKQAPANLEQTEKLEHSTIVAHSNHFRVRTVRVHAMAIAETANVQTTACASAAETSAKLLPSSNFTNPALLCSAVTAPQVSDFGSNTTILPSIGSNTIPSSTHFYEK